MCIRDRFYNAELFLRAHGSYSIRIVDPLRFYAEAVPRNASRVEIEDINGQYMNEFLEGLRLSLIHILRKKTSLIKAEQQ